MRIEQAEIEGFIRLSNRFRLTPIVDDDFPSVRDEFDAERIRLTKKIEEVKAYQKREAELDILEKSGAFGKW